MPPLGEGIPPLGEGIPLLGEGIPPLGEGMPPLGEGIPPDGGMGMPAPPEVTPPVVLQPLTITAATAIASSGFSKGLPIRLNSMFRIGVRLSVTGNAAFPSAAVPVGSARSYWL